MLKRIFIFGLIISLNMFVVARGEEVQPTIRIVCTSFPCYDFARVVAGDAAEIALLIKPGAEVHSYEPTPTDILAVGECDLFIYIGGESDVWVDSILESFGEATPESLRLMEHVNCLEEAEGDHGHEEHSHEHEYDEHIWTAPSNALLMVDAIKEKLSALYPDQAVLFEENAGEYARQIRRIDDQFREVVAHAKRREIIFADRFPFLYFVEEYGLEYAAAYPGCSAEGEPSARTMVELIDRIKEDQIPVIYVLEFSSGRVAQTLSEETGAEIQTLQSIQNVTLEDFENGESYVSLMRRNVEALQEGLN